jgi:UDP-N-acetylglucosamine 3-dehydrogenase
MSGAATCGTAGQIRFGVIGVGLMGQRYARILASLSNCHLVAVSDLDPARSQDVASALGCDSCDTDSLLNRPDIEAVCICTPEQTHADIACAAIQAGKDLFVEKPLAPSAAQARQVLGAARGSDRIATVGHLLRFEPHYRAAFQRVLGGVLGKPLYAYAWRESRRSAATRYIGASTVPLHLMVHDIDLLRWYTGSEVVRVQAVGRPSPGGNRIDVPQDPYDAVTALLEFSGGMVATLVHSWSLPDTSPSPLRAGLRVVGSEGEVEVDLTRPGVAAAGSGGYSHELTEYFFELEAGLFTGCLRAQVEHFAWCVANRAYPLVSLEDGYRAVEAAEAIAIACLERRAVRLAGVG